MSSRAARTLSNVEPCKTPVDHLNNKQFSYLLEDISTDDASKPVAPNSPNLVPLSPFMRKGKNKKGSHPNNKYNKVRTSSIQVNTTETEIEQLEAIKKEVQYLQTSVPHFGEIYDKFQVQWSTTKRSATAAAGLILIQSLTEWITNYGTVAVKEYAEFRESAEGEILSMVHKVEALNHEIRKMNLLYQEIESEKEDAVNESAAAHRELALYKKQEAELNEEKESVTVTADAINDLEKEVDEISKKYDALKDKYDRIEKYWKMTQDENDELRNRNYALEEENTQFTMALRQNRESMNQMNKKHEKAMQSLQIEHENYAQQMIKEQEELIAAQQNDNDLTAQSTMTPTTGDALDAYIDADDADIVASGVTDDDNEYVSGGIISLENEINLYQYEDDEWLDDDESLSETPAPQSPPAVIEEKADEEYNKQNEFMMEKTSDYQDIHDITAEFVSSHMSFIEEQENKENKFESEKIKIEVEAKKNKCLDLQMSSTKISHTPKTSTPTMEFESVKSGVSERENKLIDKGAIPQAEPPKTKIITKRVVIERGPKKEEKVLKVGKNFSERLAMFKHLDETRGGKPQILDASKAYSLVTKWQNKLNQNDAHNKLNITRNTKNVHVTKSTMHQMNGTKHTGTIVNVVKVTKTKSHTLKPRLFGYMNIIRTTFIQQWKTKQNPRYFFVLDGLPSLTNIDRREADGDKNRQHDFLVPTLFFFRDQAEYDEFYAKVEHLATRSIEFQKLFARYAKGTFPLNKYAMEKNVSSCMKRVNRLNQKPDVVKLPISEIKACGNVDDVCILLCNEKELHRFACNDKTARDKWVKKVNKLVDKRTRRLTLINDGLVSAMDDGMSTPKIDGDGRETPPMIIGDHDDDKSRFEFTQKSPYHYVDPTKLSGRNTRASMVKLAKISDVESGLD